MFFNRKPKRKLDARARFQHTTFTRKLDEARGYRRTARPAAPTGEFQKFMQRIGLGSKLLQIGIAILLGLIIYVVYIPNFLSVKEITVSGLSDSDRVVAESAVRQAIGDAPFYNPQRNFLFVTTRRIRDVLYTVPSVFEVTEIKKDWSAKSVRISVQAKYERFLVYDGTSVYDVYNDGVLKSVAGIRTDQWESVQNTKMIKVKIPLITPGSPTQKYFSDAFVADLERLAEAFTQRVPDTVAYVELRPRREKQEMIEPVLQQTPQSTNTQTAETVEQVVPQITPTIIKPFELPIHSEELTVYMSKKSGGQYRVIVDATTDLDLLAKRLQFLLSQTPQDRYNSLYYIDLRIENRGYICLVNTPCQQIENEQKEN